MSLLTGWTRRRLASIFISALATPIVNVRAESTRPFCSYSLRRGWGDTGPQEYITREARRNNDPSGVPQVVDGIMKSLSFNVDFGVFLAEGEDNAFATVAGGRKILVVDVDFVDRLNRMVGTQWAAISVIAHEVGHHIAGFSADRHRSELNADYWSGQALMRLGSSRQSAMKAILTVGTDQDTDTHPNKRTRAATISRGWEDAGSGRVDYTFCDNCR